MHILLVAHLEPEQEQRLREIVPDDVVVDRDRNGNPPVTAIIGGPPPEYIEHLHRLDWVQFRSDSLERWADTLRILAKRGVTVTRTRGTYNDTVPDHAIMLLIALARDMPALLAQRAAKEWDHEALGPVVIEGSTLGLIGVGSIGREVARRALSLGMRVLGVDPAPVDVPPGVESVVTPDGLRNVLAESDFVVVTVPHTPSTVGMIGAEELAVAKAGVRLVNVGRGVAVDTDALLTALDEGALAAAALDVVEPSPLPEEHPLWSHPRVILTGHSATAGSRGQERQFGIICENVRRYVTGEPLDCVVDLDAWLS